MKHPFKSAYTQEHRRAFHTCTKHSRSMTAKNHRHMKYIFPLFLLLNGWGLLHAQAKLDPPISSGEIIKSYHQLVEDEEYEEAFEQLNTVNEGDTNYISVLLKKVVSSIYLEKYERALDLCEEGLSINPNSERQVFLLNKGYVLSLQEKHQKSKAIYEALMAEYPFYRNAHINMAYQHLSLKNYQEAYKSYQENVKLFPFDVNGHLNLGLFAYHEGKYAEALMALNLAILLNPLSEKSLSILTLINELSNNAKIEKEPKKGFEWESDEYDEINLLFENYVALNKKYKVKSKSKLHLTKQNHMIFSKLSELEVSDYFFSAYYAPFYIKLMEEDYFEEMQLLELASSKNESHIKLVEKNKKDIEAFYEWFKSSWYQLQEEYQLDIGKGEKTYLLSYHANGDIKAIGNQDENGESHGEFLYLYKGGSKQTQGDMMHGKKEGEWLSFYENGNISQKLFYKQDKIVDTIYLHHKNGVIKEKATFSNGKRNGYFEEYYKYGSLYRKGHYKDGQFDKEVTYYFKHGTIEYDAHYQNGKLEGELKEYYSSGQLYRKEAYAQGESNGAYEVFWPSGKPRAIGSKEDNQFTASYKSFFQNGSLYLSGTYDAGEKTGEWVTYNIDGQLIEREFYEKDKMNGVIEYFDHDGKLYAKKEMKDDWLVAYTYFDKNGGILAQGGHKKKSFLLENYYPDGTIDSKGKYQVGIGKIGKWEKFDHYGNLSMELNYKENKLNGKATYYYPWGNIKRLINYREGKAEGYYAEYFHFDQLSEQGYYRNDELEGVWETYYPDGTLKYKQFYLNGKRNGKDYNYAINGKLDYYEIYEDDILSGGVFFDTSGNVLNEFKFKNGTGTYLRKNLNGTEGFKGNYMLNTAHGVFEWKHPNGKLSSKGRYVGGRKEGKWEWFYEDGKTQSVGDYSYNQKTGVWKSFYPNGEVEELETFINGKLHGKNQLFNPNGKLSTEIEFKYGDYHGAYKFYSPLGNLQMVRVYRYDKYDHYYYFDKNGKQIIQPIENGNAEVKAFFKNEKESRSFNLTNGYFNGPYKSYYQNGQLAKEYKLVNDDKHGKHQTFYENGQLKKETTYFYEYKNGLVKEYHQNGNLKKTTDYVYGIKHGYEHNYDKQGKLLKKSLYYNGENHTNE